MDENVIFYKTFSIVLGCYALFIMFVLPIIHRKMRMYGDRLDILKLINVVALGLGFSGFMGIISRGTDSMFIMAVIALVLIGSSIVVFREFFIYLFK